MDKTKKLLNETKCELKYNRFPQFVLWNGKKQIRETTDIEVNRSTN